MRSITLVPTARQLLSYEIAARRGLDVYQPRNLAKSVKVEWASVPCLDNHLAGAAKLTRINQTTSLICDHPSHSYRSPHCPG